MHHDNSALDKFLAQFVGKPYQLAGQGNPGYDCLTLTAAVLHQAKGFIPPAEIFEKHMAFWTGKNPEMVFEKALELLSLIWRGSHTNFDPAVVQPWDVVVYKYHTHPVHMAVYVGQNMILTARNDHGVVLEELTNPVRLRTVHSVFRVGK